MAGLCAPVLEAQRGDEVSCPRSQGMQPHQSMELTRLGCQCNSILILTSPLEITGSPKSCELAP